MRGYYTYVLTFSRTKSGCSDLLAGRAWDTGKGMKDEAAILPKTERRRGNSKVKNQPITHPHFHQ